MKRVILVEGFECTGKTTICNYLVKKYSGKYIHNPSGNTEFTNNLYKILKSHTEISNETKMLVFAACHRHSIETINSIDDDIVICDRSILSTIAYQNITFDDFNMLSKLAKIPNLNYDKCFVLMADKSVILERLKNRYENDNLDEFFVENIDRIMDSYKNNAKLVYPDAIIIDTTELSLFDLKTTINNYLGE